MRGLNKLTWIMPHAESEKTVRRMYAATDTYMFVCVYDTLKNTSEYWRSAVISLDGNGEPTKDVTWERCKESDLGGI